MSQKIVGCITSSSLREGFIPHHIQNMMLKNYVESHGNSFLLSWTEYKDNPSLVGRSLLNENFYDGICFYSIEQIFNFTDALEFLYELKRRNIWVGFAKEHLYFKAEHQFESVLKIWWLKYNLGAS